MDRKALLAQLKAAYEEMSRLGTDDEGTQHEQLLVGKALALVTRWDRTQAILFQVQTSTLDSPILRNSTLTEMRQIVQNAICQLELEVPQAVQQVFGPGAEYDFYVTLKRLVSSANIEVFLVDPYLNEDFFDLYVEKIKTGVKTRVLLSKGSATLRTVIAKYKQKPGVAFEARTSKEIHDRVLMIDGSECWVIGQSIKDAAKKKPTYIAPIPEDVVQLKANHYDQVWKAASPL